ncbi:MAG: DUF3570 domain-containing protein [Candidatus Latescibacteria bacterium]|nr:DUF3570 domain-containing protein [Candidatus Latescibacterota bacterium]
MQVTHTRGTPWLLAIALAGVQVAAWAPCVRAGIDETTASYLFNYYTDVEGVDVYGHYVTTGLQFQNNMGLTFQWVHDRVVIPAIEAPPGTQEAADAITSASRPIASSADPYQDYVKTRNSFEGGVDYHGYSAGYYVSKESDYFAQMVSLGFNRDVRGDNLNIAVGASYSWDSIEPLEDQDTAGIPDYRRTTYWSVVATQVVTKTTVLRVGAEFNQVSGLQHDPYRNVYVAGTNVPESHPDQRTRRDLFVGLSQYVYNRSSIKLDYRFYSDDWGVESHMVGLKLNQYVNDEFVFRYRYRYYAQLPSEFYRIEYTDAGGIDGYQTGDYRLGDFGAHLFGGQVLWHPHRFFGRLGANAQVTFGYERYFNSNNFSADVFETGLQIAF